MTIKSVVLALLPFTLLTAQGAPAKRQPMEGLRFGLQGGLTFGTSDTFKYFSDKKMGFTFGGQCSWDVHSSLQRLRVRLEFTALPQGTVKTGSGSGRLEDDTVSGVSAGLDYLYFTQGVPEGFYLTVGLTVSSWKQDSSLTGATTSTNPGLAGGVGWQFNRDLGVEVRGSWSRWDTNLRPVTTHNAATVGLQASYRF